MNFQPEPIFWQEKLISEGRRDIIAQRRDLITASDWFDFVRVLVMGVQYNLCFNQEEYLLKPEWDDRIPGPRFYVTIPGSLPLRGTKGVHYRLQTMNMATGDGPLTACFFNDNDQNWLKDTVDKFSERLIPTLKYQKMDLIWKVVTYNLLTNEEHILGTNIITTNDDSNERCSAFLYGLASPRVTKDRECLYFRFLVNEAFLGVISAFHVSI